MEREKETCLPSLQNPCLKLEEEQGPCECIFSQSIVTMLIQLPGYCEETEWSLKKLK